MAASFQTGLQTVDCIAIPVRDPDTNRLQITAHAPDQADDMLPDEEKWRRIIENRKKQGKGLSRWESGGKKMI